MSTIAMIASLGPETHYTRSLAEALLPICTELELLTEKGDASERYRRALSTERVVGLWRPDLTFPFAVGRYCRKRRFAAIHLQHEFNMYSRNYYLGCVTFITALLLLRRCTPRLFVTIHAVIAPQQVRSAEVGVFRIRAALVSRWLVVQLFRLFYGSVGRICDRVIVHTEHSREILCREFRVERNKCVVIPHGIPLAFERFRATAESRAPGEALAALEGNEFIAVVGYLVRRKGVDTVLHAFHSLRSRYPDLRLVVAGRPLQQADNYRNGLEALAEQLSLGESVSFPGFLSSAELEWVLRNARAVVVCHRVSVGSSGVLALALGAGQAVIATDQPTLREVITDHENGLLFSTVEELTVCLEALLGDTQLAERMRGGARETARRFSWGKVAEDHLIRLYRSPRE